MKIFGRLWTTVTVHHYRLTVVVSALLTDSNSFTTTDWQSWFHHYRPTVMVSPLPTDSPVNCRLTVTVHHYGLTVVVSALLTDSNSFTTTDWQSWFHHYRPTVMVSPLPTDSPVNCRLTVTIHHYGLTYIIPCGGIMNWAWCSIASWAPFTIDRVWLELWDVGVLFAADVALPSSAAPVAAETSFQRACTSAWLIPE